MTSTDDISICIQYDEDFVDQIEDGEADPYTGIKIRANGNYLYGTPDRCPKNWVTYLLNAFTESLPGVIDDEKEVITNHNGPSYFVFEPHSEMAVQFTHVLTYDGIDDPEERLSSTESVIVRKEELIEELVQTGEQLHEKILEINPDLKRRNDVELLRSNLEVAQKILSKF